jgi:hypothetical protein
MMQSQAIFQGFSHVKCPDFPLIHTSYMYNFTTAVVTDCKDYPKEDHICPEFSDKRSYGANESL